MPPKIVVQSSSSPNERENKETRQQAEHEEPQGVEQPPPTSMATATRTQTIDRPVPMHDGRHTRLTPILPVPPAMFSSQGPSSSSATSPSGLSQGQRWSPGPYTPSNPNQPGYFSPQQALPHPPAQPRSPAGIWHPIGSVQPENHLPQKRPREPQNSPYGLPPQVTIPSPILIAARNNHVHNALPPQSARSSTSAASTASSTRESFPLQGQRSVNSRPPSDISSSNSITGRCALHIRQQPRAARAGPDGKDRRNIDPPPVLQLMLTDFDPDSPTDLSELKSNHYVVHCKLISAESPRRDVTTQTTVSEDGSRETSRLLLGTNVAGPFFCADDPDVSKMPQHPKTAPTMPERPPSPSARFLPPPPATTGSGSLPGAFFIFADLSVRRAGSYRLEFTLMKIDHTATNLPMIHMTVSQPFKVVNAKDFDQVHQSTDLVKGLLERGAPFPLKLKKGIREGQKRRMTDTGEEVGSVEGSIEGSRPDEEREEGYD